MLLCKLATTLAAAHAAAALAFRGAVGESPRASVQQIGFCTGDPGLVYRAYSNDTYNTDHLYTRDPYEIDAARPHYRRETDCCRVFAGSRQSDAPLVKFYRLYNKVHWDHFYTLDEAERDAALATGQYNDEGVLGWVMAEAGCASWPLFRLFRGDAFTTFDHFYTVDPLERDSAIATGKYVYEGIAAWVWPA